MKKFLTLVLIIGVLIVQACEGPMGPPGMDGQDGMDGQNIVAEVFEVQADFTSEGNFGFVDPYGFDILESDKVLVYMLFGEDNGNDVWRLLPQTIYVPEGIFSYNYDFTFENYSVFMEGNFDLNQLGPEWSDGQIFRVLIVPADRIDTRMDYADHEAMLRLLNINENGIQKKFLN